jgi:hypothetical protein
LNVFRLGFFAGGVFLSTVAPMSWYDNNPCGCQINCDKAGRAEEGEK